VVYRHDENARYDQDMITFTLLGHTEENPVLHFESLRESISEAYHVNWQRYSIAKNKDQKDKDAGKKLSRTLFVREFRRQFSCFVLFYFVFSGFWVYNI